MSPWLVVGIGNGFRSDDAAGLEVARDLAARGLEGVAVTESDGEPASLMERWRGCGRVVLVDAVDAGSEPGAILRFDAGRDPLPTMAFGASTHVLGLGEAIELARALGRLPETVLVYGIQGGDFSPGTGLSEPVRRAVAETAERVVAEMRRASPQ